jgi:hypothetical protein
MTRKTLAIAFALAVALALAACSGSDSGGEGAEGAATGASGGDVAVDAGTAEGGSASSSAVGESALEAKAAPVPGVGVRVIQTASLRLTVRRGGFDQAVEEARSVAGSLGGFIVSSSESRDPGSQITRGTLVLRVPQSVYAAAMRRLGDLGKVAGREESGQDVSAEFVDLEARKRHLEAVETQLLELLERADDVAAALAVQVKLDDVQLRLEEVRGRLRYLDDQTAFATISLVLRERLPAAGSGGDEGGILDAWADGASAFANVAGRTFVVLATIAPVLLLVALVALAIRVAARRGLVPRWGASDRA